MPAHSSLLNFHEISTSSGQGRCVWFSGRDSRRNVVADVACVARSCGIGVLVGFFFYRRFGCVCYRFGHCGYRYVLVDVWPMIILFLCQIGGFGMMTAATLLGLMVNRSLRLRTKLVTQVETHSLGLSDIGSVAKLVFVVTVVVEVITAVFLTTRFYSAYPMSFADAAWNGVFHAISAFNNAGFSIYPDSLMRFAVDPLILLPIMVAIMVSGVYVGFGSHSRV